MGFIEIPILESAAKCDIRFNTQALRIEVEADCPFCGDTKKHMSLNTSRNVFRCNRCNESGNS